MSVVFRRTTSGLNNQHLFHKVDIVVFVEGGKTQYNKTEVYSGSFNHETEDIIFWTKVFENFVSGKKLKFKSVGSKSTIKEIALDIIDGEISTVIVAMDNEFDEILKKQISHPNIYYTYGYSWENDVWNGAVVKSVIEELTAIEIEHSDIENNFDNFIKDLKLAVYADGYMFKKESSFFPRKKSPMFCVDCNPVDLPSVKKEKIEARLTDKSLKKNNLYSYGSRHSIETKRLCYGHLLADYCVQLIIHYLKNRHSLKNISKDIIYRMGLNKFFKEQFSSGNIYEYYREQFEKNVA
tara:strand:- start:28 stop:912 length:885 start_codon:yes stop_codon:yes gene_type:complete